MRAVVTLADGRRFEQLIEHAVGSTEQPMSHADPDRKVLDLCEGMLPADRAHQLLDVCRTIDRAPEAGMVAQLAKG